MSKSTHQTTTAPKTSADANRELTRLLGKQHDLDAQRAGLVTQRAAREADRVQALYAAAVDDDPHATERTYELDSQVARLDLTLQDLDPVIAQLGTRIATLERTRDALLEAERLAAIDVEIVSLEALSARLDAEILPLFVRECAAWTEQVQKVTQMASLPGSRTPETQLAEAMFVHFRGLMPTIFRGSVSVPSQARDFSDWARRCRRRVALPVAAVQPIADTDDAEIVEKVG